MSKSFTKTLNKPPRSKKKPLPQGRFAVAGQELALLRAEVARLRDEANHDVHCPNCGCEFSPRWESC